MFLPNGFAFWIFHLHGILCLFIYRHNYRETDSGVVLHSMLYTSAEIQLNAIVIVCVYLTDFTFGIV